VEVEERVAVGGPALAKTQHAALAAAQRLIAAACAGVHDGAWGRASPIAAES
jgi:hypothetical protein